MSTDPAAPVLTVRGLSVDFALRTHILHAVRAVDFTLRRGETLCLVGESGSGKSVTALSLLQLTPCPGRIVAGEIVLHGGEGDTDIAALPPSGRAIRAIRGQRIGLVFQEPMSALSPVHTIGAQLMEAVRLSGTVGRGTAAARGPAERARAIELLRQVEIAEPEAMLGRYSFEFSGGMRQRAMIAIALAGNPDVLIADEPTTALDVTTQAEVLDLIKRLQQAHGMAVLLITHDMGVVAEVADRVAVMRFGRIVEQGDADTIFHRPQHPYTQRLLAASTRLEQPRAALAVDSTAPILSVRGLGRSFVVRRGFFRRHTSRIAAVTDASFDLHAGENLGIVGESGSGKTTLGRLILRTLEPDAGSVLYRERGGAEVDVTRLDREGLRRFHRDVRLVFQDPFGSLNPRMTVKDVIGEPLRIHGLAQGAALTARVADLMGLVGLDPLMMERFPHAFSGGQRQRIGIARALALDPRIIIADEATSALDVSIRGQILDLLLDLQSRLHLSFIFISHDISVVRAFCHRVVVMHRGRIVETGSAEQICTAPAEPYTQRLISAVPNPDPRHKRMLHRQRFAV